MLCIARCSLETPSMSLRLALAVIVAICVVSVPAGAQSLWQDDGTPVCIQFGDQVNPSIAPTCKGGLIVAWEDLRDPSDIDVYSQLLSEIGTTQWLFGGVPVTSRGQAQQFPQVAVANCQIYLAWQDYGNGASPDVYVQSLSTDGTRMWSDTGMFLAYSSSWANSLRPEVAVTSAGNLNVVWEDWLGREGVLLDPYPGISCNQIAPGGDKLFASQGIMVTSASYRYSTRPVVAKDGGEGMYAAWVRSANKPTSGNQAIMVARVDGSGVVQWITYAGGTMTTLRRNPVIINDGQTGCIVVWQDRRNNNWDIYAQRLDSDGNLKWGELGVAVTSGANHDVYPKVASDGNSGAIVTWRDSTANDIYAQRIGFAGDLAWSSGIAVCDAPLSQSEPAIAATHDGGSVIVWTDERSGNKDIYYQQLDSLGQAILTPGGAPLCDAASDQLHPMACSDLNGGALCVWVDYRFGNADIYGQRLNSSQTIYLCGDADSSGLVSITDAVYLVNYIFAGGPQPNPVLAGDLDCNRIVSITDAVYLVNFIFAGGCRPCGV